MLIVKTRLAWLGLVVVFLTGAVPEKIALKTLPGPDGRPVEMKAPERGASAVVFYSSECPISNAYSTTLNRIATEAPAGRVRLVGVCVDPDLTDDDVVAHAKDFGLKFPVVRDRAGALSAQFGAAVTPEAFVIDAGGRVRYHGRIDDQFAGRGKPNANSDTHELKDALDAVLAGRAPTVTHVKAVGCPIPEQPPAPTDKGKSKH